MYITAFFYGLSNKWFNEMAEETMVEALNIYIKYLNKHLKNDFDF